MVLAPYSSRLRYLDADDLDDSTVSFNELDVNGTDGEKLGGLDGFIVDAQSGRLYYAVVDSGGWFRSRRFLLPVGHAMLEDGRRSMRIDVSKDAVKQFPEFDSDRFREFSDEELQAFEQRMTVACCPDDSGTVATTLAYDTRRHYTQPEWWRPEAQRQDRYQLLDRTGRARERS